ncbi:MAG: ASCH domain-containing protein [Robiginitalea sp.]
MKNNSAKDLWADFLDKHPEYTFEKEPGVDHFGDTEEIANSCLRLVLKGKKQATTHSLLGLQFRNEVLPKIDDLTIITDWEGTARCIIRTVKVRLRPFFSVGADYALLEGEGDSSLEYWRRSHWDYYTRELEPFGKAPTESMIVVCEAFEKIF